MSENLSAIAAQAARGECPTCGEELKCVNEGCGLPLADHFQDDFCNEENDNKFTAPELRVIEEIRQPSWKALAIYWHNESCKCSDPEGHILSEAKMEAEESQQNPCESLDELMEAFCGSRAISRTGKLEALAFAQFVRQRDARAEVEEIRQPSLTQNRSELTQRDGQDPPK